jgi:hypothetical protein
MIITEKHGKRERENRKVKKGKGRGRKIITKTERNGNTEDES